MVERVTSYHLSFWESTLVSLMEQKPEAVLGGIEYFARRLPQRDGEPIGGPWTGKRMAWLEASQTPVELEVNLNKATITLDCLNSSKLLREYLDRASDWQSCRLMACFDHLPKGLSDRLLLRVTLDGIRKQLMWEAKILREVSEVKGQGGTQKEKMRRVELEGEPWDSLTGELGRKEMFAYMLCQLRRASKKSPDSDFEVPDIFESKRPYLDRLGRPKGDVTLNPLGVAYQALKPGKIEGEAACYPATVAQNVGKVHGMNVITRTMPGQVVESGLTRETQDIIGHVAGVDVKRGWWPKAKKKRKHQRPVKQRRRH